MSTAIRTTQSTTLLPSDVRFEAEVCDLGGSDDACIGNFDKDEVAGRLMAVWDCLRGYRVQQTHRLVFSVEDGGGTAGGLYCSMAAAVPWDYSELAAPGAVVNSITRV